MDRKIEISFNIFQSFWLDKNKHNVMIKGGGAKVILNSWNALSNCYTLHFAGSKTFFFSNPKSRQSLSDFCLDYLEY